MSNEPPPGTNADAARIRAALDRLLRQPAFVRAPQMSSFLRYVVEQTLCGESERIKAYTIGVDALGKPSNFDPQTDPSVRVLAKRLRDRLREHYAHHVDAPLRIELVSGSYTPRFSEPGDPYTVDQPDPRACRRPHESMFHIDSDDLHARRSPGDRHAGALSTARTGSTTARDRLLSGAPPGAPVVEVLYLITAAHDDRLARNISFLLSGMLSRIHGTDARRVTRTPTAVGRHDRSLTVHVTPLGSELRVDLQVCHGASGEIVNADVLDLHPSENGSLGRDDLYRLETWVENYAAPDTAGSHLVTGTTAEANMRPAANPTAKPCDPLAGWLASGRTTRVSSPGEDTAAGDETPRGGQAAGF